ETAGGAGRHEDAVFGAGTNPASAKKRDAISGFTEADGSAHHSLFEMPEEEVPTIKASFSELEAEIDESQGPSEGTVDFDIPEGGAPSAQASPAEAPAAKGSAPADENPIDFNFDEEDFALPGEAPAAAPGTTSSPEARIASLLDESRRALKAGRYSEA